MTKEQMFEIWAPPTGAWSAWVKPVLFSSMDRMHSPQETVGAEIGWAEQGDGSTAMVLDLPGADAVAMGLALARLGYRPVALYNACPPTAGALPLIAVEPIMSALAGAAIDLAEISLPDNAPPVFLLDCNRRGESVEPMPEMFDNRSISLPTDFPSANLLMSRGIERVIVVQPTRRAPQADLSHTLRRWQESGIEIFAKELDQPTSPHSILVNTPPIFKVLWYNALATLGLKRSPLGGFGGLLPLPSGG